MSDLHHSTAVSVAGAPLEAVYDCLMWLIKKRGMRILEDSDIPDVMGQEPLGVCVKIGKDLCIAVRSELPIEKRTYVLAHELAHYMLHRNEKVWPKILFDFDYYMKIEREAQTFTRKLLTFINLRLTNASGECRFRIK
jgi:Zn-dependent peptidase ImmA (M78 family)